LGARTHKTKNRNTLAAAGAHIGRRGFDDPVARFDAAVQAITSTLLASDRRVVAFLRTVCLGILIAVAAGIAYANSFAGTYVLDDDKHIIQNERSNSVRSTVDAVIGGRMRRPLVELSLAINKHFAATVDGQPRTWGFHLFNLIVHTLAGLVLFGLVRRTLSFPPWHDSLGAAGPWIAFVIAMIWVVHPLQTQSVTYIIQRGESMMGLFYLLTMYCVVRAVQGTATVDSTTVSAATFWKMMAVFACAAGMGCKAVMVTAPLIVYLYDALLLSRSYVEPIVRRRGLYLGLCATWGVLFYYGVAQGVLSSDRAGGTVGFSVRGISAAQYFMTQLGVIPYYLRLAFWPAPLCLDYAWKMATQVRDVLPIAAVTIGLVVLTIYGLLRRRWWGMCGVWFFGILFPTSSFIPIRDVMFEHRLYLPLAAVIALGVLPVGYVLVWLHRNRDWPLGGLIHISWLSAAMVVVPAMLTTIDRNRDYHSDLGMWRDVLAKSPHNARAYLGYGEALFNRKQYVEAGDAFKEAVRRDPRYVDGWYNLGNALSEQSRLDEAVDAYQTSLTIHPENAKAHYNLGNARYKQKRLEEAVEAYQTCLAIHPRYSKAYYNLGNTYKDMQRYEDAIAAFRKAIEHDPQYRSAYINLANTLKALKRFDEAIPLYHVALTITPNHANAHFNLGDALFQTGDYQGALREVDLALKADPNHEQARHARTLVLKAMEREP
jgi:tetratricopeptide (TPR) repeat protein